MMLIWRIWRNPNYHCDFFLSLGYCLFRMVYVPFSCIYLYLFQKISFLTGEDTENLRKKDVNVTNARNHQPHTDPKCDKCWGVWGGMTNERPGSDDVISGPMRGLDSLKIKFWHNGKKIKFLKEIKNQVVTKFRTQNVTTLKLKLRQNSKTLIVTKLKNCVSPNTHKLKRWQKLKK